MCSHALWGARPRKKHLGILPDAGMVSRRKEASKTFYVISDPQIFELCDLMCSKLQKEFSEKSALPLAKRDLAFA